MTIFLERHTSRFKASFPQRYKTSPEPLNAQPGATSASKFAGLLIIGTIQGKSRRFLSFHSSILIEMPQNTREFLFYFLRSTLLSFLSLNLFYSSTFCVSCPSLFSFKRIPVLWIIYFGLLRSIQNYLIKRSFRLHRFPFVG